MVGFPPSMAATAEFVVPRSMPTTFSLTTRRGLYEELRLYLRLDCNRVGCRLKKGDLEEEKGFLFWEERGEKEVIRLN